MSDFITMSEAARRAQLPVSQVSRLIAEGRLRSLRAGSCRNSPVLVSASELDTLRAGEAASAGRAPHRQDLNISHTR
jgi:excisionase family DNA binding protein